jgi:hypothetical protein
MAPVLAILLASARAARLIDFSSLSWIGAGDMVTDIHGLALTRHMVRPALRSPPFTASGC